MIHTNLDRMLIPVSRQRSQALRGKRRNSTYFLCFVRRIWAHKISFFVPRPRDVAHPGSGPAQDWLRFCSGLLTLRAIFGRLRRSMHNYFNSSRASPDLVPYIKMAKLVPLFRRFRPHRAFASTSRTKPNCIHSYFYCSIP